MDLSLCNDDLYAFSHHTMSQISVFALGPQQFFIGCCQPVVIGNAVA